MNARAEPLAERAVVESFVFASASATNIRWLADTLVAVGAVEPAELGTTALAERIATLDPLLVFVDFSGGRTVAAAQAVHAVRSIAPQLQVVAVGTIAEPESALAALRAGVRDFIDLSAGTEEAARIARNVLEHVAEPVVRNGRLTALIGARPGVGVSTLAANLAVTLQRRGAAAGHQAALVDLGLPAGDAMLYLNARGEFDFVEAVRNLRRFDQTFVHTAFASHASGLALTALPPDLSLLRTISFTSAVALLNRLRAFFDQQIVDLGGFSNIEFIAHVASAADEVWLVCDPSIASIVSASTLIRELTAAQFEAGALGLVVNKFDPHLGLSAEQIALRLELPLVATLPARSVPLGQAANQGKLLAETAERDPYVRAVSALVQRVVGRSEESGAPVHDARATVSVLERLRRFIPFLHERS